MLHKSNAKNLSNKIKHIIESNRDDRPLEKEPNIFMEPTRYNKQTLTINLTKLKNNKMVILQQINTNNSNLEIISNILS